MTLYMFSGCIFQCESIDIFHFEICTVLEEISEHQYEEHLKSNFLKTWWFGAIKGSFWSSFELHLMTCNSLLLMFPIWANITTFYMPDLCLSCSCICNSQYMSGSIQVKLILSGQHGMIYSSHITTQYYFISLFSREKFIRQENMCSKKIY